MRYLKKIVKNTSFPAFMLLIVFVLINMILSPGVINKNFILVFFTSNTTLTCVVVGTALVIMGGGIDISLGALVSLVNVILTQLVSSGWGLEWAILISLVIATVAGALNGCIIGFLRVSPMLATFATLSIFTGLALWIMPLPGGRMPNGFRSFYTGSIAGIPISMLFIVFVLILSFIVYRSPLGIKIKAIGWDSQKAYLSGIRVSRVQFFIYVFAGFVSGIGAIGLTANIGGGDPSVGISLSMSAIASCIIGGIALSGGVGNTLGAVFGSLFLGLLINTVVSARIPPFYQDLAQGGILLLGMIAAVIIARRAKIDFKNKRVTHNV